MLPHSYSGDTELNIELKGVIYVDICRKNVPGKSSSKCKNVVGISAT